MGSLICACKIVGAPNANGSSSIHVYPELAERFGAPSVGRARLIRGAVAASVNLTRNDGERLALRVLAEYESAGFPLTTKGFVAHLFMDTFGIHDLEAVFRELKAYERLVARGILDGPSIGGIYSWLIRDGHLRKIYGVIPPMREGGVFTTEEIFNAMGRPDGRKEELESCLDLFSLIGVVRKLLYHSRQESLQWQSLKIDGEVLWLRNNLRYLLLVIIQEKGEVGITLLQLARDTRVAALVTTRVRSRPGAVKSNRIQSALQGRLERYLRVAREVRSDHSGAHRPQLVYRLNEAGAHLLRQDPLFIARKLSPFDSGGST